MDRLGLTFVRIVPRLGEVSTWPALDPTISGDLVQQAVLEGPGALPRAPGLELLPELGFGWDQDGPIDKPWWRRPIRTSPRWSWTRPRSR